MHFAQLFTVALSTSILTTHAFVLPEHANLDTHVLSLREAEPNSVESGSFDLEKRRGGGGGRSSGGGGSTGGSTGGTTGGTSGGGTRSGGTGGSGSGGRYGPSYGGRYPGGATTGFPAGRSIGAVAPVLLIGGGVAFWAVASGYSWGPYGVYRYQYPANITFYNSTTMMNESLPGVCLCSRYQSCSCSADTPGNDTVTALVGDGTYGYAQDNEDLFQFQNINGTRTLAVNGTIDNSTAGTSPAGSSRQGMMAKASLLGFVAVVGSGFLLL